MGLGLVNLGLLAFTAAALVGAGIGMLSTMWCPPGDVFDDELLVEFAVPLATAAGLGALAGAGSFVVAWLAPRRTVPRPGAGVAASAAILVGGMLVLGIIPTAAFVPALALLEGPPAVPHVIGFTVSLGLLGAPLGALATWWMTAAAFATHRGNTGAAQRRTRVSASSKPSRGKHGEDGPADRRLGDALVHGFDPSRADADIVTPRWRHRAVGWNVGRTGSVLAHDFGRSSCACAECVSMLALVRGISPHSRRERSRR